MFDKTIRGELALLLYITGFTANTWECFASNDHFAKKFGETPVTISRKVKKLIDRGYITATYEKEGSKVVKRTITVNKFDKQITEMITGRYQEWYSTVIKNDKDTNTSITNTSITKEEKEKQEATAIRIYDYYKSKFWSFKKPHKRKVSLDRIKQRLKLSSEPLIIKAIDAYFRTKDISETQFIKPCENFFWYEPWTKFKFIETFLDDIKEEEQLKNTCLQDITELQLKERIGGTLESISAFKKEIRGEFEALSDKEKETFKEMFKKVEEEVLREAGIYR